MVPSSSEGHRYNGPIANGYWVDASNIKAGYLLLNDDESWSEVVSVKIENKPLNAYNITVSDFHTYFVATNQIAASVWVHNNCGVFGTTKVATDAAQKVGFSKVKQFPFDSHGQPVYKRGGNYITPDADGHNGGVWKVFDRRGNRIGTADADLNIFAE